MININIQYHLSFVILLCHPNIVPRFICHTEGTSMLNNELIKKEMVECNQTSKSKEQEHKNKDYLKYSIYSLLQ